MTLRTYPRICAGPASSDGFPSAIYYIVARSLRNAFYNVRVPDICAVSFQKRKALLVVGRANSKEGDKKLLYFHFIKVATSFSHTLLIRQYARNLNVCSYHACCNDS